MVNKLILKVWDFQFKIWEHRNKVLHVDGEGFHQEKVKAIGRDIREEFMIGKGDLSSEYLNLFQVSVQNVMDSSMSNKMK